MLFSIIIPTFNRRELLRRTLDSIPGAEDSEVIVVDDGSTEGTLEMLQSMGDRIRAFSQLQQGPGAARNRGAAEAAGDYLAFLDSDDLWFPWTLSIYRSAIARHNRPAFLAGKPKLFDDESELAGATPARLTTLEFTDYLAGGDEWRWWGASSFVIRRDAFHAAGGFCPQNDLNGEDHDLAMKLGTAAGFVQITNPATFAYRRHAENVMRDMMRTYRGLRWAVEQEETSRYPGGPQRRAQRLRILCRQLRSGSVQLLQSGHRPEAWEIYRKTARWNASLGRFKYLCGFPAKMLLHSTAAEPR